VRRAKFERRTSETDVRVELNLDGKGASEVSTGIPFLDHMLNSFSAHSLIDLKVLATGDLRHHVVEDVAICLGEAMRKALGDRAGIRRFGYSMAPMDDALALAAVDLVERPYSSVELKVGMLEGIGGLELEHFIRSLAASARFTVHLEVLRGFDGHHMAEAAFKALALAMRQALERDERRKGYPSSKGSM